MPERKIIFYSNYFFKFYEKQDKKVRNKIDYVIDLIKFIDRVPIRFIKFLEGTDSLYEIKVSTTFKQIDQMVYKLYELTDKEIEIVEKSIS